MVSLHEPLARRIAQISALAAQRLGKQESRRPFHVQRGGMELDKLDIGDLRARAPGHRHAVSGGDLGIGGFAVDASESAGSQQHRLRPDRGNALPWAS